MANKGYKVTIEGADQLKKIFDKFPDVYLAEIKKPLGKIGAEVEKNAKAAAPVHMGNLRGSIINKVTVNDREAYVKIAPSLGSEIYPVVMEFGRKPGSKPPPIDALIRWVELVIKPPVELLRSTTFLIARSIGAKGIKGREYMKKGLEQSESKFTDWVLEAAQAMVDRIAKG